MKKTYIIPEVAKKEVCFTEGFLALSKGYIQDPDGKDTGETIIIVKEEEEEAGAKVYNGDWDFSSEWDFTWE